jgi:hypothetical protein
MSLGKSQEAMVLGPGTLIEYDRLPMITINTSAADMTWAVMDQVIGKTRSGPGAWTTDT